MPGKIAGWTQVYADNFNGSSLNKNAWTVYKQNGGSNTGTNWWDASHVNVSGGNLNIKGYVDPKVAGSGGRIVTGGVGLWALKPQTYGKYEVLMRMDSCKDVKYVALLWPTNPNITWPKGGEIDFAEDEGGSRATTNLAVHYYDSSKSQGNGMLRQYEPLAPALTSWHVMGVEWTKGKVVYTVDGKPWGKAETSHVPSNPMTLVVQTESLARAGSVSLAKGSSCNAQVAWVVQYK